MAGHFENFRTVLEWFLILENLELTLVERHGHGNEVRCLMALSRFPCLSVIELRGRQQTFGSRDFACG